MGSAMAKDRGERTADQARSAGQQAFPWERQPDESVQAYARFLAYRDIDPTERSHRKVASICAISETLVNRWGKRWSWTKRAMAYDMWVLELGDQLGKRAVLGHRHAAARFGSIALAKASRTVEQLNEAKLTAGEAIDLAVNGTKLARQALAMTDGETRLDRAPVANVAISLGSTPPWLTATPVNDRETEARPVVPCAEQVIAGESSASSQRPVVNAKRLAEKIVKSPKAGK